MIDYNSRWLSELGSEGMIRLAGRYTLARMMERDDFRKRWDTNQPISLHELLYPLVQGYDSVAMKADVELGGHDQIFNLLVARDLMKEEGLEPQVVLTVPLLVGTDGVEKMSKSLGNAIGIEEAPGEIYGKTMSIPDELMWDWILLLSDLPEETIEERKRQVAEGTLHPKAVKQELARALVGQFHDAEAARAAEGGVRAGVRPGRRARGRSRAHGGRRDGAVQAARRRRDGVEQQRGAPPGPARRGLDRRRPPRRPLRRAPPRAEPYLVKVGKRRFARIRIS